MATAGRPLNPTDPGLRDRDLDPPPGGRPPRGRLTSLRAYQRLVANPFLAIFGVVVWFGLFRAALEARSLGLFLATLAGLVLVPSLLQFHCLDCGRTGRLMQWNLHACTRVEVRKLAGRPRRLRGPTPVTQTTLWFLVVAVGSLMAWILFA